MPRSSTRPEVLLGAGLLAGLVLAGCVTPPGVGLVGTKIRGPVAVAAPHVQATAERPAPAERKVGRAESYMAFGLFAHGDASIDAAMRAGGITRVHHVDYEYKNAFGLFSVWTTLVYGE